MNNKKHHLYIYNSKRFTCHHETRIYLWCSVFTFIYLQTKMYCDISLRNVVFEYKKRVFHVAMFWYFKFWLNGCKLQILNSFIIVLTYLQVECQWYGILFSCQGSPITGTRQTSKVWVIGGTVAWSREVAVWYRVSAV